eukprot:15445239-Alexandrium_andersonii.AAC.1
MGGRSSVFRLAADPSGSAQSSSSARGVRLRCGGHLLLVSRSTLARWLLRLCLRMTSAAIPLSEVRARWCFCHLRSCCLGWRCWRTPSGSQRRASFEAGPSGAAPGAEPTGLPPVLATLRRPSASPLRSAASCAHALRD